MSDRSEDLRHEAARLLERAQAVTDPDVRAGLIRLAAKFHELAGARPADLDGAVRTVNAAQMVGPTRIAPVMQQQQQQIQPKKEQC
jgi:hypothetical protein